VFSVESTRRTLVASLGRAWACLFLFLGLVPALSARADLVSGLSFSRRQLGTVSNAEISGISLGDSLPSGLRVSRVRQCIEAPAADRGVGTAAYSRKSIDRFALGAKIDDPISLRTPTKLLHEKTIGRIRPDKFTAYANADGYWAAAGTGTRGKFFESQSVLQANSSLKKQGSLYRYAITAVENDPGHPADVVLLNAQGRVVARYQLKSTRNVDDIVRFASDARYTGMPIVTHPETLAALQKKLDSVVRSSSRRGLPIPAKWESVSKKLIDGQITDRLVEGKRVSSYAATSENARRFRVFQWGKGPSGGRSTKQAADAVAKSVVLPRTLTKVGVSVSRIVRGTFVVLEVVSAPVDLGFAAYGFYDAHERYSQGRLDQDLYAAKLSVHTTQAALGGAAFYSLGVGLELIAAPEPIVTKVVGVVVVVGGVVVIATDIAVDALAAGRDRARQQMLEALGDSERHLACRDYLLERLRAVSGR
jgi:hypothetical protein